MSSGEVRLRYSGFILFLSRLLSVGTGILFSLMVTRNIPEKFGVFSNIGDVLSYFTLMSGVLPFWAARFVARRHPGASATGIVANTLTSLPFALTYVLTLPQIMASFGIGEEYVPVYTIVALEIVEVYLLIAFESVLRAERPQAAGFGFLAFEACKVVFGFVLIIRLGLGLFGVIVSIICAYLIQLLYYVKLTLNDFHQEVRWSYVREWIKASPLNLYAIAGQRIAAFYLILLFIYGGELSRGYYGAAATIANVVGYSALLGYALYPRLLSGDRPEDVQTSLRMVLMFALPMTTGAIVLANSYLTILNPIFTAATSALSLLAIDSLCNSLTSVFGMVVSGTEKLDVQAKISYREMVRSRLFIQTSLPYLQAAVLLPLTYYVLNSVVNDAVEATVYAALMVLVTDAVVALLNCGLAKRSLHFGLPWTHIGKYAVASIIMAVPLYLLPPPARISTTLAETLFGGVVYFSVLCSVDVESRSIVRSAKNELLKMLRISPA